MFIGRESELQYLNVVPSSPHVLCCTAAAHSQGVATPWLTISRSADRPMGTGDAGRM